MYKVSILLRQNGVIVAEEQFSFERHEAEIADRVMEAAAKAAQAAAQ